MSSTLDGKATVASLKSDRPSTALTSVSAEVDPSGSDRGLEPKGDNKPLTVGEGSTAPSNARDGETPEVQPETVNNRANPGEVQKRGGARRGRRKSRRPAAVPTQEEGEVVQERVLPSKRMLYRTWGPL